MITACGIMPAKTSFMFKAIMCLMLGKIGQNYINKAIFHKSKIPPDILEFQQVTSTHFKRGRDSNGTKCGVSFEMA